MRGQPGPVSPHFVLAYLRRLVPIHGLWKNVTIRWMKMERTILGGANTVIRDGLQDCQLLASRLRTRTGLFFTKE